MDTITKYQEIIEKIISEYTQLRYYSSEVEKNRF